ncbi:hypothetical protein AAY473_021936 [Plecturocebus cupreus]
MHHQAQLICVFLVEMEFCHVGQAGHELLTLRSAYRTRHSKEARHKQDMCLTLPTTVLLPLRGSLKTLKRDRQWIQSKPQGQDTASALKPGSDAPGCTHCLETQLVQAAASVQTRSQLQSESCSVSQAGVKRCDSLLMAVSTSQAQKFRNDVLSVLFPILQAAYEIYFFPVQLQQISASSLVLHSKNFQSEVIFKSITVVVVAPCSYHHPGNIHPTDCAAAAWEGLSAVTLTMARKGTTPSLSLRSQCPTQNGAFEIPGHPLFVS